MFLDFFFLSNLIFFSLLKRHKNYDLRFVEYYRPKKSEVKHLRILLHGPVGAGKSSFINSVDSCLRGKVNSNNAFEDAAFGSSFTKQVCLLIVLVTV